MGFVPEKVFLRLNQNNFSTIIYLEIRVSAVRDKSKVIAALYENAKKF